jgi:hypothetical protein
LASNTQAAARSGPLLFACKCDNFHFNTPKIAESNQMFSSAVLIPRDQGIQKNSAGFLSPAEP